MCWKQADQGSRQNRDERYHTEICEFEDEYVSSAVRRRARGSAPYEFDLDQCGRKIGLEEDLCGCSLVSHSSD